MSPPLAIITPSAQICSLKSGYLRELAAFRKVQGEPGTCCHVQKQRSLQIVTEYVKKTQEPAGRSSCCPQIAVIGALKEAVITVG